MLCVVSWVVYILPCAKEKRDENEDLNILLPVSTNEFKALCKIIKKNGKLGIPTLKKPNGGTSLTGRASSVDGEGCNRGIEKN